LPASSARREPVSESDRKRVINFMGVGKHENCDLHIILRLEL
jgi:hypothetical protein